MHVVHLYVYYVQDITDIYIYIHIYICIYYEDVYIMKMYMYRNIYVLAYMDLYVHLPFEAGQCCYFWLILET